MALLTIIIFYLSKKITNNDSAALVSAFLVGILPVLFTNDFSVDSLFLPLIFFAIYCFLNLPQKKYLYFYLGSFLILSLTSPATFLIIIGLGIYLLLSYLENKRINEEEKEVLLFSLFVFLWIQLLFFKKVFLQEGISFIWQNIPTPILQNYFPQISILGAIALVSVIPFIVGIIVVYRSLFQVKNRMIYLLISLVIATTALSWFKLLKFNQSLTFFGITLTILFAPFYLDLTQYLEKTKWNRFHPYFPYVVTFLLLITIIPLTINTAWKQETPSEGEVKAFLWLQANTPEQTGVLSLLEEGNLVTYYGQRRNLMDEQFSLIPEVESKFEDLHSLYTTKFQTLALKKTEQHQLQYLTLTPRAKSKYGLTKFSYITPDCFKKVYDEDTKIYQVKCSLQEVPT